MLTQTPATVATRCITLAAASAARKAQSPRTMGFDPVIHIWLTMFRSPQTGVPCLLLFRTPGKNDM